MYVRRKCRQILSGSTCVCMPKVLRNVSFAKEPYKRDDILQKRPMNLRSTYLCMYAEGDEKYFEVAYMYVYACVHAYVCKRCLEIPYFYKK